MFSEGQARSLNYLHMLTDSTEISRCIRNHKQSTFVCIRKVQTMLNNFVQNGNNLTMLHFAIIDKRRDYLTKNSHWGGFLKRAFSCSLVQECMYDNSLEFLLSTGPL